MRPRIGVRVKLASEGSGRWRDSAGEKSKFGLFVTEILELFNVLKSRDMLDCLQLVHCHPGSQLQDIRRVKDADQRARARLRGAEADGRGPASTSTSAAASASTTTAAAPTSPRR